jgi:hypothetical protein
MSHRYSDPITFVLNNLLDNKPVDFFDINNAVDQWNKIQERKPVAFALDNGDGNLYDLRKMDNPYHDRYKVVPLYRD